MKVKELIEILQNFDPEKEVRYEFEYKNLYDNYGIEEVVEYTAYCVLTDKDEEVILIK